MSPLPFQVQLLDINGDPLSGGLVYTYIPGTLSPLITYRDEAGSIPQTNPAEADAAGRLPMWASGDVRLIIKDSNGVLISDYVSTAPLRADVINPSMFDVVGAPTHAVARTRLGVDDAIAAAIAAVDLTPGPPGPTGPAGPLGPVGPGGSSGGGYTPSLVGGGNSYVKFPNANGTSANIIFQGGSGTVSGGNGSVLFPTPFPNRCFSVVANTNDAASGSYWVSCFSVDVNGFQVKMSSPLVSGWTNVLDGFYWLAWGY